MQYTRQTRDWEDLGQSEYVPSAVISSSRRDTKLFKSSKDTLPSLEEEIVSFGNDSWLHPTSKETLSQIPSTSLTRKEK